MLQLLLAQQSPGTLRAPEMIIFYLLFGTGCAAALWVRRGVSPATLLDGLWLALFWPLYGPILLSAPKPTTTQNTKASSHASSFIAALRRAAGTPLAKLLPEEPEIQRLSARFMVSSQKIQEIDALLSRPELSEESAQARLIQLKEKKATERALSAAQMRLQHIQRLRSLKQRFTQELDEVEELLAQLTAQAEVARLAGASDENANELVREVLQRVEAFGQALDEVPGLYQPEEAEVARS